MSLRTCSLRTRAFAAVAVVARSPQARRGAAERRRLLQGQDRRAPARHRPRRQLRSLRPHLRRASPQHIPGNPIIVVEHMPGAGGVTAGNHLFGPGPQDGTKILLSHAIIMSEVLDPKAGVRFQSAKFNWIGTYDAIAHTLALWHESPVKTIDDLKKQARRHRLVRQGALHLSVAGDDEGRAGAQLQAHHRLPDRQPQQPRDGARRDPRLGGVMGEPDRHPAALDHREEGRRCSCSSCWSASTRFPTCRRCSSLRRPTRRTWWNS